MDAQQLRYRDVIEAYQGVIVTRLKAKDILAELTSRGVKISRGVQDLINEGKVPKTDACSALLRELTDVNSPQHRGWFKAFIESLEAQNYTLLVRLLNGNTLKHKDFKQYTDLINLKAPEIEKEVKLDAEFMSLCMAEELINPRSREEIMCEQRNNGNMNAVRLLLTVIHRYHVNWFAKFMTVLVKCNHRELAEEIAERDFIADLGIPFDDPPSSSQEDAQSFHMDCSGEDDGGIRGWLEAVHLSQDTSGSSQETPEEYYNDCNEKKAVKGDNTAGGVVYSRRRSTEKAGASDSQKKGYHRSNSGEKKSTSTSQRRARDRPTTASNAASSAAGDTPVAPSGERKYVLTKRNGNIKRCQGCRVPFNESDEAVLKVFESHSFYNTNSKTKEDTPRNYYYHPDKSCVCKTNPKFSARLVIADSKLRVSPQFSQLMETKGFLK